MKNNNMVFAAMAIFAFGSNLSAADERSVVVNNQPTKNDRNTDMNHRQIYKQALFTGAILGCCQRCVPLTRCFLSCEDRNSFSNVMLVAQSVNIANLCKNYYYAEKSKKD